MASSKNSVRHGSGFGAFSATTPISRPKLSAKAGVLEKIGKYTEALQTYDRALKLKPTSQDIKNSRNVLAERIRKA